MKIEVQCQNTRTDGTVYGASLYPIPAGSKFNEEAWRDTPQGVIQLDSLRGPVLEAGKEYVIEITEKKGVSDEENKDN